VSNRCKATTTKSGNVGIGTTEPGAGLQVNSTNGVSFKAPEDTNRYWFGGMGDADGAEFSLYNDAGTQKVRIAGSTVDTFFNGGGNVGIGTTNPTSTLHVIGTGNFSSNLYAGSCTGTDKLCTDIAELFPSEAEVSEGDVVCLKSNGKAGHCDKEFDSAILGVISTAPAIIIEGDNIVLGKGNYSNSAVSDGKMPIALKGRVPVKAICSTPIKQGDLLVSAGKKGFAQSRTANSVMLYTQ